MNHANLVAGFRCGLPCVAVRVVIHATPGLPQQWHTVTRREGESEEALADRAMAIGVTLAKGGHAPGWFMLQNVAHVSELEHEDAWHNTRFACHRHLHDPKTPPRKREVVARRLLALHGDEVPPVTTQWVQ